MQEENNHQESQISLSAFLSLQKSVKNEPGVNSTKLFIQEGYQQNNGNVFGNSSNNGLFMKENYSNCMSQQKQKSSQSQKLQKNYSKNYRRRHKQYVQNLKSQNQKYQKKIQQLTLKIDRMQQQIKSLKYGKQLSDNMFDSMFLKEKQQSLKQLVNQSQQKQLPTWDKVRQFTEVYGFAGRQKINLLNYYMSQIIDNLIIDHLKNFVLSGIEEFQVSKVYAKTLFQKQVEISQIDSTSLTNLKKCLRKAMVQFIKNFHKCGQQFYQSYVKLINQTIQIQNQFARIQHLIVQWIDPTDFLNILHWYEQNKFCKQIQILRKQWYESFSKT